jgi:hypothetical protein
MNHACLKAIRLYSINAKYHAYSNPTTDNILAYNSCEYIVILASKNRV